GGGVNTGNARAVGEIVNPDGTSAVHIPLALRRADAIADTSVLPAKSRDASYDLVTDENGRFLIPAIDTGEYVLEFTKGDSLALLCRFTIDRSDATADLGLQMLRKTSVLSGKIDSTVLRGNETIVAFIEGTDRFAAADSTGSFVLDHIPQADSIAVLVLAKNNAGVFAARIIASVDSTPTDISTIRLNSGYAADTLIIRAILDSNGLHAVAATEVCSPDSLMRYVDSITMRGRGLEELPPRIGELVQLRSLNLDSNMLTSLPDEIGKLRNLISLIVTENLLSTMPTSLWNIPVLRKVNIRGNAMSTIPDAIQSAAGLEHLNAGFNPVTAIPVSLCSIATLRELNANNCAITQIPDCLDQLPVLATLELQNNELASLPQSFFQLNRIGHIDINNNRLCSLTVLQEAWLESKSPGWKQTQTCP
ncbi:MAG: hypothetical protein GF350_02990, partial [Chitinivibrionales bacterium]|nr:hypothetical protein [Chitinivibrionales bacterium]